MHTEDARERQLENAERVDLADGEMHRERGGRDEPTIETRRGDGAFAINLKGVIQFDSRTFFKDGGIKGNDGFLLRRARPIISGTVFRDFDFLFVPDFGGSSGNSTLPWVGGLIITASARQNVNIEVNGNRMAIITDPSQSGYGMAKMPPPP